MVDRHVGHRPQLIAVHTPRQGPTHRTDRVILRSPRAHLDPLTLVDHILDDQREQPRKHHPHKLVDIPHTNNNDPHDSPSPPKVRQGRLLDTPVRGDAFNLNEDLIDFDVVTELGWTDRNAFQTWMQAVSDERVAVDEARFLDRSRTRAVLIDDRVTAG